MPFLNPPDVLPEAMRMIIRVLLARNDPTPEDELFRLVAPLGLVEATGVDGEDEESPEVTQHFRVGGRTIARASLAAMRGAGLIVQESVGDRMVSAAEIVRSSYSSWKVVSATDFAYFIHDSVLASARDELDDADASGGAEDLAFAVALLFSMPNPLEPIASFEHGSSKTLFDYQTDTLGTSIDTWIVRNRERYVPLQRWATYLGLTRILNLAGRGSGSLIVDSSKALRHLAVPLLNDRLTIGTFLERLAPAMPYSDKGRIGAKVRASLAGDSPNDDLSPGLALSLQVLHNQKVIELEPLSDAESLAFPISSERTLRYSHIRRGVSA
jgi:hypothetical protein